MRHALTAAAAGALLLLTGCAGTDQPGADQPLPSAQAADSNPAPKTPTQAPRSAQTADPQRLQMPAIGFDRPVRGMGLNADGTINPPAGVVQWFDKTVTPGAQGISVIAGHVEYDGPDVFHQLDKLDKGDIVTVSYADGTSKRFRVYAEESVNKVTLQRDQRVWGKSATPVLALITCDSASRVVNQHRTDNYVVWAAPV